MSSKSDADSFSAEEIKELSHAISSLKKSLNEEKETLKEIQEDREDYREVGNLYVILVCTTHIWDYTSTCIITVQLLYIVHINLAFHDCLPYVHLHIFVRIIIDLREEMHTYTAVS